MTSISKFRLTPSTALAAIAVCFFLFAAGRAAFYGVLWLSDKLSPERFVCAQEVCDFGTVRRGERPQFEFDLKNLSQRSTRIGKVVPGCSSCVRVVDYTRGEISPRESATVKLALLTERMEGEVKKASVVKYGRNNQKYVLLYLKANVVNGEIERKSSSAEEIDDDEEASSEVPSELRANRN